MSKFDVAGFNIIGFFKNQLSWLKGSADNNPGGASSKKLTGFYCFVLVGILVLSYIPYAYIHKNFDLLIPIVTILIGAGLGALGINSNEKIKMQDKLNGEEGNGGDKAN